MLLKQCHAKQKLDISECTLSFHTIGCPLIIFGAEVSSMLGFALTLSTMMTHTFHCNTFKGFIPYQEIGSRIGVVQLTTLPLIPPTITLNGDTNLVGCSLFPFRNKWSAWFADELAYFHFIVFQY
jgi:hypothetical protein